MDWIFSLYIPNVIVIEIRQSLTLAVESLTQPSPFIRAWDRLRIAKLP